jgi:hypothetical protein
MSPSRGARRGEAEAQRLHNPDWRLNADCAVAAGWEGRRLIGVETVWHARENAKDCAQAAALRHTRQGRAINPSLRALRLGPGPLRGRADGFGHHPLGGGAWPP